MALLLVGVWLRVACSTHHKRPPPSYAPFYLPLPSPSAVSDALAVCCFCPCVSHSLCACISAFRATNHTYLYTLPCLPLHPAFLSSCISPFPSLYPFSFHATPHHAIPYHNTPSARRCIRSPSTPYHTMPYHTATRHLQSGVLALQQMKLKEVPPQLNQLSAKLRSLSLQNNLLKVHTRAHTRTHTHAHRRTHNTYTRVCTHMCFSLAYLSVPIRFVVCCTPLARCVWYVASWWPLGGLFLTSWLTAGNTGHTGGVPFAEGPASRPQPTP